MHLPDLLATIPPELRDYIRDLGKGCGSACLPGSGRQIAAAGRVPGGPVPAGPTQALRAIVREIGRQGCLFNEAEQDAAAFPDDDEFDDMPDSANDAGEEAWPQSLPAHLPRKRVEHDLSESEKVCACCQGALHRMGEETSEQLDIIPATVRVLQHVRFKYACRQCDRHGESSKIVTSPMPPQPIPGSNASAGTLATVLTAKYADGMPCTASMQRCCAARWTSPAGPWRTGASRPACC